MPGMDGAGVLAELRRKRELDGTRVVMVSAKCSPRDVSESRRLGADGFLSKPFSVSDLIKTLN